jgi:hypothetical protein
MIHFTGINFRRRFGSANTAGKLQSSIRIFVLILQKLPV